jgi:hypothetical protein
MAIPIIDEILTIIQTWVNASPSWFKFLFFMALLSLVVSLITWVYDTPSFGICPLCWQRSPWEHPRIFQPQACANLTFQIQQQSDFSNSQDVISLADCINNQNVNCYCSFTLPFGSNLTRLECGGREWISSASGCEFYTSSPLNSTKTLYQYCIENQSISTPTNSTQLSNLMEFCKDKGLDLLNAPFLWGATILIMCIGITFTLASILGIFNKE